MPYHSDAPTYLSLNSIPEEWHRHPNGGGWVYSTAKVAETAFVGEYARVFGNARVLGYAIITDYAAVSGDAYITGKAVVSGYACVTEHAMLADSAVVKDEAIVTDIAYVGGNAVVGGNAWVGNSMTLVAGNYTTPKAENAAYLVVKDYSNTPNPYLEGTPLCEGGLKVPPFANADFTHFFKMLALSKESPKHGIYSNNNYDETTAMLPAEYWKQEPVKPKNLTLAANFIPRTQKAKGIHALATRGYLEHDVRFHKIETADPSKMVGQFVRPCPMTPRHGFVDSRMAETLEDAKRIIEETRAADDQAEFIVMPFMESKYSGIFTPGLLSVGLGHDGATAGTSSVSFPAIGKYPSINPEDNPSMFTDAGIKDSEYIEILWEDQLSHPTPVQLRDGPRVSQELDHITKKIKVKKVVKAEGDLLEWETKMKKVPAGTVVYHPNGSLASHYAIHAVLNKVPIVISFEPKVGDLLEPKTESKEINIDLVRAGFMYAQELEFTESKYNEFQLAAKIMLASLHHISLWAGRYDFLIGIGMGFAYRLTIVAALGEYRHNRRRFKKNRDRDAIYEEYWPLTSKKETSERMICAMKSFACDKWGSNYGGEAWFTFAKHATDMLNHLITGNVTEAIEAYNRCVNAAHNNGWAFNKFCANHVMSEAAQNPVSVLLFAGPALHKAVQIMQDNELISVYASAFADFEKYPEDFHKKAESVSCDSDDDEEDEEDWKVTEPVVELQFKPIASAPRVHVQYRTESQAGSKEYSSHDLKTHSSASEIYLEALSKVAKGLVSDSKSFAASETHYYRVKVASDGSIVPWNTLDFTPFAPPTVTNDEENEESEGDF